MRIDSLSITNFRCIAKLALDKFPPITIVVGRNNTGKSTFLEAVALASSGSSGWFDALGDDIIEAIVLRRGGWKFSELMVKIGAQRAELEVAGRDVEGTVEIATSTENMSAFFEPVMDQGLNSFYSSIEERINRSTRRVDAKKEEARSTSLDRIMLDLPSRLFRNVQSIVGYRNHSGEHMEYAILIGEALEEILSSIYRETDMLYRYGGRKLARAIRSSSDGRSEVNFMLTPSIQYLRELQKRLARGGELINLINLLRKKISYFEDLREVDDEFLVFLKGLDRPFPLQSMGDGFRATLAILAGIAAAKHGIVLMEEPEIRMHPGYMFSVANAIIEASAQKEAQFFISTHSLDFLEAILTEKPSLVRVVRMYRSEETGEIDYESMNGKDALAEIKDFKLDLRGI
jgi:AAA15 family ATPase/GTPase